MTKHKFIINAYDENNVNWKATKQTLRIRLTHLTNDILRDFGKISVPPESKDGAHHSNITMYSGCSGILFALNNYINFLN